MAKARWKDEKVKELHSKIEALVTELFKLVDPTEEEMVQVAEYVDVLSRSELRESLMDDDHYRACCALDSRDLEEEDGEDPAVL